MPRPRQAGRRRFSTYHSRVATGENVLIIMSDEHQARALGAAGDVMVHTPNLDRLAERGARFTRCWTPSPICVSARGSFATGRWVHEIGTWHSAQPYDGDIRGWAHEARDAGREVVSIGKLHYSGPRDDHGFTETIAPMWVAGGIGWVQGLPRRNPLPYPEAAEMAEGVGVGHTSYTRYDERVTAHAVEWLHRRERAEDPWVLFVSFVAPHYPLSAPEEFASLTKNSDLPDPDIAKQSIEHPAVRAMADFFAYHRYFDSEGTDAGRRAYRALIAFLDSNVGKVLDALDEIGATSSTRVIYTSDHGEMEGNRGLWGKSYMYRDSVGVPLIVAGPDVAAGATVDTHANLVDICATVRDTLPPGRQDDTGTGQGVSLWEQMDIGLDRPAFSEYHDGGSITGSFCVRVGDTKLVHHEGERPELFDLATDPDELTDVSDDPNRQHDLQVGYEALGTLVDTTAANAAAFASQEELIARLGGRSSLANFLRFNHTPVPE